MNRESAHEAILSANIPDDARNLLLSLAKHPKSGPDHRRAIVKLCFLYEEESETALHPLTGEVQEKLRAIGVTMMPETISGKLRAMGVETNDDAGTLARILQRGTSQAIPAVPGKQLKKERQGFFPFLEALGDIIAPEEEDE